MCDRDMFLNFFNGINGRKRQYNIYIILVQCVPYYNCHYSLHYVSRLDVFGLLD